MNRHPLGPVIRVITACAELAWRGAKIRAARLQPEPMILIDEPRLGVVPSYGYATSAGGGRTSPVFCQAHV
ncbi:MAG: hypothetical protein KAX46_13030, partial [Chromatiaceae bacterium]|nr:hypothetical protein [Chromatiaceae bacterium]